LAIEHVSQAASGGDPDRLQHVLGVVAVPGHKIRRARRERHDRPPAEIAGAEVEADAC
jgi:hypothetical protein